MARRTWGIVEQKQVAARQGWCCNVCQELLPSSFQLDHVVPLSCAGSNHVSNAQALCGTCHADKTQRESLARTQRARVAVVAAKLRAAREPSTMEDNPFAQFAYLPGVGAPQHRSQHSTITPATASRQRSRTTIASGSIRRRSLCRARQTTPYKPVLRCLVPKSTPRP